MSTLRQDFLDGMSCVAATVNIVTTDGPAGRAGVTVSAMSSVSADTEKPTLLVCVNDMSAGAAPIIENGKFTVNILRDDQSFVSDTFAGRYGDKGEEKFACAEWFSGAAGTPVLKGAVASFDCRLAKDEVIGQHHVFFGEVEEVHLADHGRALIYANRSYSTALSLPPISGPVEGSQEGRLCLACLSSFAPFYVPSLLVRLRENLPGLQVDVLEGDQAQVAHLVETGEAHLGLLYDRDLPATLTTTHLSSQRPYALFAAGSALAAKESVTVADMAEQPFILLDQPLSRDYVCGLFTSVGLEPNVILRPSSIEMVRSLVGHDLGCAVLVTQPMNGKSYDGCPLAARPLAGPVAEISIALARKSESKASDMAAQFAQECIAYFDECAG